MDSPGQVPLIERFKSVIPFWAHPFVSDIKDVSPYGNCGFRAVAVGLGLTQKHWPDVRQALINEMDTHETFWRLHFDREIDGRYDLWRSELDWFNTVKPAPNTHWFHVPPHGHLVAQTYGCVLINLHGTDNQSYFPTRDGPNQLPDIPVIAIGNVGGNHWIYVKLEGDFPMPWPVSNWARYAQLDALEWQKMEDEVEMEIEHEQAQEQGQVPGPVEGDDILAGYQYL
ncbi:uncharacterized protein LOC143583407 [Bidens hawaiensis]|uniref:uncharacterized protein LOC143583407 n=1 Tax=Bidens hawaiensis TaxID=980011 RepID=UPI00404B6059